MKKPKKGWEFYCDHANEVPRVCPCPVTCGCRYYHCKRQPPPVFTATQKKAIIEAFREVL